MTKLIPKRTETGYFRKECELVCNWRAPGQPRSLPEYNRNPTEPDPKQRRTRPKQTSGGAKPERIRTEAEPGHTRAEAERTRFRPEPRRAGTERNRSYVKVGVGIIVYLGMGSRELN